MSDCIFCKIVNGDIPADKVFEDEEILAFKDLSPVAPVHVLIIPKKHIKSLDSVVESDTILMGKLLLAAKKIAKSEGLSDNGYRVVNNVGEMGGQTVNHFHLHLVGGRSMQWPPG